MTALEWRLLSKVAVLSGSCSNLSESVTLVQTSVLTNPDGPAAVEAIQALRDALGRVSRNFDLLLAGKPVRDVAETKAEIAAALVKAQ
jgi:hypothetical protein